MNAIKRDYFLNTTHLSIYSERHMVELKLKVTGCLRCMNLKIKESHHNLVYIHDSHFIQEISKRQVEILSHER